MTALMGDPVVTYSYNALGELILTTQDGKSSGSFTPYETICGEVYLLAPSVTFAYTADGGLASYGPWTYTYDSDSRLVSVSSNGVLLVMNAYDYRGRRVRKTTPTATHTFLYDDWNLIRETVAYTAGGTDTLEYFWGRDLSGSQQGAGGVGGLLYLKRNGTIYIPFTDANGNITAYAAATGALVADYVYDAFGRTISQSGPLADLFRHRFSSK